MISSSSALRASFVTHLELNGTRGLPHRTELLGPFVRALILILPIYFAVVLPQSLATVVIAWSILLLVFLSAAEAFEGRPVLALASMMILLLMQNFLIGLFLNLASDPSRSVLLIAIEAKTLYAISLLIVLVSASRKAKLDKRLRTGLVASLLLMLIGFITAAAVGRGEAFTVAAYLRNFLTPLLYVSIGALLAIRCRRIISVWVSLIGGIVAIATPVALFQLFFPSQWEDLINITTLESVKGPISALGGLPGLFSVPRSAGIVGEGVNAAYAFGGFTLVLWSQRKYFTACLAFILCLVAFGKGGMLLLVTSGVLYVLAKRFSAARLSLPVRQLLGLSMVGAAITILAYVIPDRDPFDRGAFNTSSSAEVHVLGLKYGLGSLKDQLIGHGIGVGGNFSDIASGATLDPETWIRSGSESAIGVISFQVGALGLISIVLLFYIVASSIMKSEMLARCPSDKNYCSAVGALVATLFGLLFIQENVLSPQAVGACYLSAGIAVGYRHGRLRGAS